MLLSIPVLDRGMVDSVRGDAAAPVSGPTRAPSRKGKAGIHPKARGKVDALFPAGAWQGITVEELTARVGTGTVRVCCPHRPIGGAHRSDVGGEGHALFHSEEGRPAFLSCFCCSLTYTYGAEPVKRPTIEEVDALDLAPTEETIADRLLRDEKYGGVIGILVAASNPSDVLLGLAQEAMRGEEGAKVEAERVASLEVYEERLKAKRAKADARDPRAVEAAKRALAAAAELVGAIRKKMRAEGLPLPDSEKPCGVHLGLHHREKGILGTHRQVCVRTSCPTCAPVNAARKIAAVLCCPVTASTGEVTGGPLGLRPVWVYRMSALAVPSFTRRWRRVDVRNSLCLEEEAPPKGNFGHRDAGHALATFHLAAGQVVIVSTLEVPGLDGERVEAVRDLVVSCGTDAFRVDAGDVEGLAVGATVVGGITSSHGLSLDPAGIAATATASQWVGLGPVNAGKVRDALEARKVEHQVEEREEDGANVVERVTSVGYVAPAVVSEVVAESSTRRPPPLPVTFSPVPEIDVDELLASSE